MPTRARRRSSSGSTSPPASSSGWSGHPGDGGGDHAPRPGRPARRFSWVRPDRRRYRAVDRRGLGRNLAAVVDRSGLRGAARLRHPGVPPAAVAGPACARPGPGVLLSRVPATGRRLRSRPRRAVPARADVCGESDPVVPAPHRAKTLGGWRWRRQDDASIVWTAPAGHQCQVPIPPVLDDPWVDDPPPY
jgi:hypothetical protein